MSLVLEHKFISQGKCDSLASICKLSIEEVVKAIRSPR